MTLKEFTLLSVGRRIRYVDTAKKVLEGRQETLIGLAQLLGSVIGLRPK